MAAKLELATLNSMDTAQFVDALGSIYEKSAWVAERAHARAPFASLTALADAMAAAVASAPDAEKLALLRAHPDLAGKAALAGDVTRESSAEQARAGLGALTAAELERFTTLNAAYKAKDFPTALSHYDKAIELDPEEISFLTNKAAVFFEQAEYDECIETCDTAIEKGRELRVDYKVVARAMTRKGNALVKQDKLEEAVETYSKSLMEHRTADTLKRKDDAEREIKDRKVKAYLDPAKAETAREEGNELFKQQKYPEAVERYTESIKRDPEDHRVYSNRAACYTKLTAFNEALKDAEKCIALKPDFPKGYTRKGHVEFFTKQYDKALETYQLGLSKDPTNEELKDGLRRTMIEIQKGQTGQVDEAEMKQRQERAMQDPEIQNILSDPVMRQVLNDMSTDPKAAAEHQKNPMIMAKIQKLINAGIVQTR